MYIIDRYLCVMTYINEVLCIESPDYAIQYTLFLAKPISVLTGREMKLLEESCVFL